MNRRNFFGTLAGTLAVAWRALKAHYVGGHWVTVSKVVSGTAVQAEMEKVWGKGKVRIVPGTPIESPLVGTVDIEHVQMWLEPGADSADGLQTVGELSERCFKCMSRDHAAADCSKFTEVKNGEDHYSLKGV